MDGSTYGKLLPENQISVSNIEEPSDGITARLAVSPDVWRDAWTVRHAAYAASGLIDAKESGLLVDEWDTLPSTKTIVIYKNGMPVSTARVCLYAPDSGVVGANAVPAMDVFKDDIVDLHRRMPSDHDRPRAVEIARLARHPDLGADHQPVFALYRMASYLVLHFQADAVIAAVQKHHVPFYRRLGFQRISDLRPYAKLKVEGALMACVRPENGELREVLPVLRLVSAQDSNYHDFLAGYRVPVFGTTTAPVAVDGMIDQRFVGGVVAGRRERPHAASPADARPLALAA